MKSYKNILLLIALISLTVMSCTKEVPLETNISIDSSISGSSSAKGFRATGIVTNANNISEVRLEVVPELNTSSFVYSYKCQLITKNGITHWVCFIKNPNQEILFNEGEYKITAIAYKGDKIVAKKTDVFKLQYPSLRIISAPQEGSIVSGKAYFCGVIEKSSCITKVKLHFNNKDFKGESFSKEATIEKENNKTSWSYTLDTTTISDFFVTGKFNVRVEAYEKDYMVASTEIANITIDNETPQIIFNKPINTMYARGDFSISGEIKKEVESVSFDLARSDGYGDIITKECVLRKEGNKTYFSYPLGNDKILDGEYYLTFKIKRNGKITSITKYLLIDNTPPIVVFDRPATSIADSYYDLFDTDIRFMGTSADDSGIAKMIFYFYESPDLKEPIATYEKSDIDRNFNFSIAKYDYKNKDSLYSKIYGDDTLIEKRLRYMKVQIYDRAGNSTDKFFIRADSNNIFNTYSPQHIYKIINGTYEFSNNREMSSDNKNILKLVEANYKKDIAFYLYPDVFPKMEIDQKRGIKDICELNDKTLAISEDSFCIIIDASVNNVSLNEDSFKFVYCKVPKTITNDVLKNLQFSVGEGQIKSTIKYGNGYKVNIKIDTTLLTDDTSYLIKVIGNDMDNMPIKPKEGYGYHYFKSSSDRQG